MSQISTYAATTPALADATLGNLAANSTVTFTLHSLAALYNPQFATGRLSVSTGNAYADVANVTTIVYTSVNNDGSAMSSSPFQIVLFDGTRLKMYVTTERSLNLTIANTSTYDVFMFDNAGTLTLTTAAAWTSVSARSVALASYNGLVCKVDASTQRWVGTIGCVSTNQISDTSTNRMVSNAYNVIPRKMDTGLLNDIHAGVSSSAWQEWHGGTSSIRLNLTCARSQVVDVCLFVDLKNEAGATAAINYASANIDVTNANGGFFPGISGSSALAANAPELLIGASGKLSAAPGKHFIAALEFCVSSDMSYRGYQITGSVLA